MPPTSQYQKHFGNATYSYSKVVVPDRSIPYPLHSFPRAKAAFRPTIVQSIVQSSLFVRSSEAIEALMVNDDLGRQSRGRAPLERRSRIGPVPPRTLSWWSRGCGLVLFLLLCCWWAPPARAASALAPWAIPSAQGVTAPTLNQLPLITPLEATTIALHTHAATIYLADAGSGLAMQLDATYRLENKGDEGTVIVIKISGAPPEEITQAEVALTANGQPLSLFWTDGVGYTAQVQVGANAQTNLQFTYTLPLVTTPISLLQYNLATLRAWAGVPSVGVTLTMPATLRQASWLRVTPSDWRYADSASGELGIKWLYDGGLPAEPFLFAFITPATWQQVSALTEAAQRDSTQYQALGALYAQLWNTTPPDDAYRDVRERFYAQALAAYTAGIEALTAGGGAGDRAALAPLYQGLATLYRSQVAQADGTVNLAYAQTLVDAVRQALATVAPEAAERAELTQWLADGLQVLLGEAQRREEWPQALALVDELAALPATVVDSATLAQTKRSITIRQALQLVEENHREAAVALAGDAISDATLMPPPQARTLFRRWEITTTILPQQIRVELTGIGLADQAAAATAAMAELATSLQGSAAPQVTVDQSTVTVGDAQAGRVVVTAPASISFAALAGLVPAGSDWALAATLLRQLQPTVELESAWLQQQVQLSQSLDLRAAGEIWGDQATALETEAAALETQAAALNPRDPTQAEQALKARIQAANYRTAAQRWQRLAQDSWVAIRLVSGANQDSQTQSGIMTVTAPAQRFTLQSTPSPFGVTFVALLAVLFALLLLSGVLWWLL